MATAAQGGLRKRSPRPAAPRSTGLRCRPGSRRHRKGPCWAHMPRPASARASPLRHGACTLGRGAADRWPLVIARSLFTRGLDRWFRRSAGPWAKEIHRRRDPMANSGSCGRFWARGIGTAVARRGLALGMCRACGAGGRRARRRKWIGRLEDRRAGRESDVLVIAHAYDGDGRSVDRSVSRLPLHGSSSTCRGIIAR